MEPEALPEDRRKSCPTIVSSRKYPPGYPMTGGPGGASALGLRPRATLPDRLEHLGNGPAYAASLTLTLAHGVREVDAGVHAGLPVFVGCG